MAGILFQTTKNLSKIIDFYTTKIEAKIWINQTDCIILKHDNFLLGFCQREKISTGCLVTFFYSSKQEVDRIFQTLKDYAVTNPMENKKYNIYQFFAKDPEGRDLEFQAFLHEIDFDWRSYNTVSIED
ncbi:MAG: VOC family protein [Candidatus Hodarchaeota archaeon]